MRFMILASVVCAMGCDMLHKDAMYNGELETCYQLSRSCEQYVACRKAVAEKYGRAFDGSCEDLSQVPEVGK
jgi:hypothetical protein